MPDPADSEQIEKSKMSFADHLEELRRALFKSLVALLIGSVVGFTVGWKVVDYIQTPLRDALETYFSHQAQQMPLERLEKMRDDGRPVPEDLEAAAQQMADKNLVPRDIYVPRADLLKALTEDDPDAVEPEATESPQFTLDDLIRLRVYEPLAEDSRSRIVSLSAHEPFMVYMKASLVVGLMVASPLIFYFIWEFIAAGLYGHERKHIYIYLPISLGLFFAGAALAFYVVFDFVLDFLFWFNQQMGITPTPRISDWMSFVLLLPLGFGISFQLPLVMLFLERIGVFTVKTYVQKWRIAILVIAILSMFLTPADPGSMLLMGVPLVGLYFGGILLCRYMPGHAVTKRSETPEESSGS
jgi:sec-independent protein translocase protein TatC